MPFACMLWPGGAPVCPTPLTLILTCVQQTHSLISACTSPQQNNALADLQEGVHSHIVMQVMRSATAFQKADERT